MSTNNSQLDIWRKKMHQLCQNPKVGEIVILADENNNTKLTYRALTSDGYDTRWQKISSEKLESFRMTESPDNLDDYVYMSDGMYIHKDDAMW
jgi:hypothetical protein